MRITHFYGNIAWCSELAKNLMYGKDLDHIPDNLITIRSTQHKIIRPIFWKTAKN